MYLHHGVSVATPAIRKNLSPADAEMPGDDAWYGCFRDVMTSGCNRRDVKFDVRAQAMFPCRATQNDLQISAW